MIIPGIASQVLATRLADACGEPLMPVDRRTFPDGDRLVELGQPPGNHAVIVAATTSSDAHLDVLLLQDAAREAGVDRVTTVIPYLGYARQDAAFEPGQPVSVRAMARAIGTATDQVILVDPHERDVVEYFPTPARAISIADRLAPALPNDLEDPLFIAPDAGARQLASTVHAAYGTGTVDNFEKTRRSAHDVEMAPSNASVAGRDVVLVDEVIATGGTMCEAAEILRERDAERIFAACVHPMLAEDAYVRLVRAGVTEVVGSDTLERATSTVSAAPAIADALDLA